MDAVLVPLPKKEEGLGEQMHNVLPPPGAALIAVSIGQVPAWVDGMAQNGALTVTHIMDWSVSHCKMYAALYNEPMDDDEILSNKAVAVLVHLGILNATVK